MVLLYLPACSKSRILLLVYIACVYWPALMWKTLALMAFTGQLTLMRKTLARWRYLSACSQISRNKHIL